MALTYSSMMPLRSAAPDFQLPDVISGHSFSPKELKGKHGLVVMFICNHCPYVVHVQHEIARIADEYIPEGIGFVGISSNDIARYPDDSPRHMREQAKAVGFHFPYLYDEDQQVARAYRAECTPDFFLFDAGLKCVYRGRMDESSPGKDQPVTGEDLRSAIMSLLKGLPVSPDQHPSMGCGIKWKR